jgi:Mn-dependent DtxR family transcriptional regulator
LRKKGFIIGEPKTFFSLTSRGKKEAKDIAKILKQKKLL